MSRDGRLGRAEVFLQWKGTNACYDFYCPCNMDEPQHFDGYFGGQFTCGSDPEADPPEGGWCGKTFELPYTLTAAEVTGDESSPLRVG